jgi:hypothetical protein
LTPCPRAAVRVRIGGLRESILTNTAGPSLQWKVTFPVQEAEKATAIMVDNVRTAATLEWLPDRRRVISTVVPVAPGQTRTAVFPG